jgi:septum formation topological specificity factor MinE
MKLHIIRKIVKIQYHLIHVGMQRYHAMSTVAIS